MANPPLPALTGLRFFAALAIFNLHSSYFVPQLEPVDWAPVKNVGSAYIAGVQLFFVLSGFILAYSHGDTRLSRQSLRHFWVGRFSRIYPVYALALIWYAPFILLHRFSVEAPAVAAAKSAASLLPSTILIQSWFHPRWAIAWNGPGWTLSVETAFYLLFPFLASIVRKLSQRFLLVCAAALWGLSVVLTLTVPRLLSGWEYVDMFVSFNPLFHIPTFAIGVALGYHYLRAERARRASSMAALYGLLAIGGITLAVGSFPELTIHNCIFVPAFSLLIYGLAQGARSSRLFTIPLIMLLGESSYSFYILQFPQGQTFRFLNEGLGVRDFISSPPAHGLIHGLSGYVLLLVATSAASALVYKHFELPMRSWIRSRLKGSMAASAAPWSVSRAAPSSN